MVNKILDKMMAWFFSRESRTPKDVECCSCGRIIMATKWNELYPSKYICNKCRRTTQIARGIIV